MTGLNKIAIIPAMAKDQKTPPKMLNARFIRKIIRVKRAASKTTFLITTKDKSEETYSVFPKEFSYGLDFRVVCSMANSLHVDP